MLSILVFEVLGSCSNCGIAVRKWPTHWDKDISITGRLTMVGKVENPEDIVLKLR